MRDNILKINKMLKESGSSIKYEIEINSGIYKIFKTKNGSGRNLVLHTTSPWSVRSMYYSYWILLKRYIL